MASAASDGVKLWDLRKLRNFQSLAPYTGEGGAGGATSAVAFDFSGLYLAVGGAGEQPAERVLPEQPVEQPVELPEQTDRKMHATLCHPFTCLPVLCLTCSCPHPPLQTRACTA